MRKTVLAGTAILALSLLLSACAGNGADVTSGGSNESSSSQMPSDETDIATRTGDFEGLNDKTVAGSVEVSGTEVVLSGFSSDEGPDLHLYLTNGTDEAAVDAGTEIDAVAFDEASQTFSLDGVDAADYDTVVIHCDKAKAVFGAAALS